MHQHALGTGGDVVGVDAVDRQIERWRYMSRVPQQIACLDDVAFCGEEVIADIDVLGFLPRLIRDIPKLVILSCRDCCVADFELDQRVRVRPRR